MTTHDPSAWAAGRQVKYLAIATLLLTASSQLLLAACAQEVAKLAPRPPAEYGLRPYLETAPYLSSGPPGGYYSAPDIATNSTTQQEAPRSAPDQSKSVKMFGDGTRAPNHNLKSTP